MFFANLRTVRNPVEAITYPLAQQASLFHLSVACLELVAWWATLAKGTPTTQGIIVVACLFCCALL